MRYALQQGEHYPFLQRHGDLLTLLLRDKQIQIESKFKSRLDWSLIEGDFREALPLILSSPEIIFYDIYSPKSTPDLWNLESFKLVYQTTRKRREKGLPCSLSTYCAATSVRAALLLSGFYVGYGTPTSAKKETTVVATDFAEIQHPLDKRWLDRFSRSSRPLPHDVFPNEIANAIYQILSKIAS
jgi:tRNA U34 5-methylaminomethyl-2-thiouridine-forming methyltransferase MnmC